MKILVINGPNLNMLGKREPSVYGSDTLKDIESSLVDRYPNHTFIFFQSNHEGAIIDRLHEAKNEPSLDAILINTGAFSHTSVAIRDALSILDIPKVEVHLSNIHARETFRHQLITAGACNGSIAGFGVNSYHLGVLALEKLTNQG